jgi:hypothetical protein
MTAAVIPIQRGDEIREERAAFRRFTRLAELAEELSYVAPCCLDEVCAEYVRNGWASEADIQMAKEMM